MFSPINLYDFQSVAVDKLARQCNVLLADDMGLGKTYQAIALDQIRRHQEPSTFRLCTLVIAPLSVIPVWKEHFERLTDLKVVEVDRKNRDACWNEFMRDGEVFLVNWEALRIMPQLKRLTWLHVIADECHRASNRKTKQTIALWHIPTKFKTGLSGTPTTGSPDKLWAILHWLYPKDYTSYWKYVKEYCESEVVPPAGYVKIKGPKLEALPKLHRRIAPFYVRRKKEEVLKDLPDKYYNSVYVDLVPKQRRAYDQMRKDMLAWVEHQDQTKPVPASIAAVQFTRLQQFACSYADINVDGKVIMSEPSSKLDALMEILDDSDPSESIVVYSNYRQLVDLASKRLTSAGISHGLLTGTIPQSQRDQNVRWFQEGRLRVFLATIQAGGIGITLTRSSHVVFLDRNWSPALNLQAEDRLHRIGQENAVQVTDIMARSTIDLGRAQRLELKWSWIKQLLGDK